MPNKPKVTRKLRAILSADIKGYSLLMADDEAHTIQTLKVYRSLMSDFIKQHSGRVVDNPGDNLLAEFSSAVDAVECAVQIQKKLRKENAHLVEDSQLQFRIGVNIGDVVQDDDRIYGSGVNVAARIEGIADAGGICISRNTYDHIKDKLDAGFEYLGEHMVKNIKEPVRVYKVLMDSDTPAPLVEEPLELPDKPSIAVLPFDNMSGDPDQEYFSDGLTEQIINGLCKVSNLFVIARNSSFAYKGKPVSVKQIAKELGVRYILEGSVQRAGDRVRITAQLIDATTDYHMWSENYDRELEDIFALQDEITMKIIAAMEINLTFGEQARLWSTGLPRQIKAYEMWMRGYSCLNHFNKRDNSQARKYYLQSIELEPSAAFTYAVLGFTHLIDLVFGWSDSQVTSFEQAEECAETAYKLSKDIDIVNVLLGYICLYKRMHDKAIEHGKHAIELNPNGADAHVQLSFALSYSGCPDEGINLGHKAMRLNPLPPVYYYHALATAYRNNGQHEEAIMICRHAIHMDPDPITPYLILASCYGFLNKDAKNVVRGVLKNTPDFSLTYYALMLPYRNQNDLDLHVDALRKAGLPD